MSTASTFARGLLTRASSRQDNILVRSLTQHPPVLAQSPGGRIWSAGQNLSDSSKKIRSSRFWSSKFVRGMGSIDAGKTNPSDVKLSQTTSCNRVFGFVRAPFPRHPVPLSGMLSRSIPSGPSLSLSRLPAWPVLGCPVLERPGIGFVLRGRAHMRRTLLL